MEVGSTDEGLISVIWQYIFIIRNKASLQENIARWSSIGPEIIINTYSKYSKISNTFLFLFSNKMLVLSAGIHKMLVSIGSRDDPDQTASEEAV